MLHLKKGAMYRSKTVEIRHEWYKDMKRYDYFRKWAIWRPRNLKGHTEDINDDTMRRKLTSDFIPASFIFFVWLNQPVEK